MQMQMQIDAVKVTATDMMMGMTTITEQAPLHMLPQPLRILSRLHLHLQLLLVHRRDHPPRHRHHRLHLHPHREVLQGV